MAYLGGCFAAHHEAGCALAAAVLGMFLCIFGCAITSDAFGVAVAPQLLLLPVRLVFLGFAAVLMPLGVIFASQACARLGSVDLGVDSMYIELFGFSARKTSVAQMELAGTAEMLAGMALVSLALRLAGFALLVEPLSSTQVGNACETHVSMHMSRQRGMHREQR